MIPLLGAKTYRVHAPAGHWRLATCQEVDCQAYARGWVTAVPGDSPQAAYIRSDRTRGHREEPPGPDGVVRFVFGPGNRCFGSSHQVIERPPLLLVQPGAMLARTDTGYRHTSVASWVDDFQTHLDAIRKERDGED